jgi:hypothetical protein
MELIYLSIGLTVGALIGVLFATLRFRAKASDSSLAIQLASAEATVSGLNAALLRAEEDRKEREVREREESRLIQELAPVKDRLEQMQISVKALERNVLNSLEQFKNSSKTPLPLTTNSERLLKRFLRRFPQTQFEGFGERPSCES